MKQSDIYKLADGKYNVENGLYLFVKGNRRSWTFRFQKDGKRREIGLGSVKFLSLSAAKDKVFKMKVALAEDKPLDVALGKPAKSTTFEDVADNAVKNRVRVAMYKEGTTTERRHRQLLRDYAKPLAKMDIAEITQEDIIRILEPIWVKKNPTAKRLRESLEMVFDYAYNTKLIKTENPARWKNRLSNFFARPSKVHKEKHLDSLTIEQLRIFARYASNSDTPGIQAVLFGILTATRAVEFCKAKWDEIDFKTKTWSVQPDHRKGNHDVPFRVPLSTQAIQLLKKIEQLDDYVFTGTGKTPHIALGTPRMLLQKILNTQTTMHGCRATFKSWCLENGIDNNLTEMSLSHQIAKNDVEEAYIRTDLLKQRRPVMQQWADEIFAKLTR